MNPWIILLPLAGTLFGLLCLMAAMKANRHKRLLENCPTSKTTGVFIGLVELKGTAESEMPFRSFLGEVACVMYAWNISEHWSRTVTESYTDSEGKSQTRTRHESGWTTVASGGESNPFYLKDDYGIIQILPAGASIEQASVFSHYCTPGDPLYYGKGPSITISNSDHRRSFTESAIPLHSPIYVIGQSRLREDIVAPEIAADSNAPLYLISTRDEAQITGRYGSFIYIWWIFGLLLWAAGWTLPPIVEKHHAFIEHEIWLLPVIASSITYIGITLVGWIWTVYNSMADLRERVRQGWSQIDIQLKRRADLIPSLASVVSGMSSHENNLQEAVAKLRTELKATPPGQPGTDHRAHSRTVIALAESYPQLRANESFLKLQRELIDTENRVALARGYYNEIATYYNTRLQVIPDRYVAALSRMQPMSLMEASDFERAAVQVKLQDAPVSDSLEPSSRD